MILYYEIKIIGPTEMIHPIIDSSNKGQCYKIMYDSIHDKKNTLSNHKHTLLI